MMYFSAKNNVFYPEELKKLYGNSWPDDLIEVSLDEWEEYGQTFAPQGKTRGSLDGRPFWVDIPAVSSHTYENLERVWRNSELERSDIQLNKVQDSDPKAKGSVSDWRNYRKALRELPNHKDFPNKSARPSAPDAV